MTIREKLFSFSWDAWNHPWRAMALTPVFSFVGVTIGYLGGVHLVDSSLWVKVSPTLFTIGTLYVGYALLAVIDE